MFELECLKSLVGYSSFVFYDDFLIVPSFKFEELNLSNYVWLESLVYGKFSKFLFIFIIFPYNFESFSSFIS